MPHIDASSITHIRVEARRLGFDLMGITSAQPSRRMPAYRDWLNRGYAGEMAYLERPDRVERRADPAKVLPGAQTIICVGMNYHSRPLARHISDDPARGLISSYAWGEDYHTVMAPRLEGLAAFVDTLTGPGAQHRVYVDTGPVLERATAADAGLGFIGKNTCLIHPRRGSHLFLGVILTTAALPLSGETMRVSCGTCTRCLEACPTQAFVAPYVLNARRCISYLTIELKGPIPRDLRPMIGNHIFGCDVCQSVCPWQRFARLSRQDSFKVHSVERATPPLMDLISLNEPTFRRQFVDTPLWHGKRRRLLRNVAVALGNWGDRRAIPLLEGALHDDEPLIRGHAAWALGQIGGAGVWGILDSALEQERDDTVREEIWLARSCPPSLSLPGGHNG